MFLLSLRSKNSLRTTCGKSAQGGFGLIELLVSLTIMTIVTSVVLVRQGSFNSAVLLRAQAYEVALTLRDVQLNAVSASGDSGSFREEIGVFFDTGMGNGTFRIYRDSGSGVNDDGYWQMSEEFGLQGFLDSRFEIRDIRPVGNTTACSCSALSVVFQRPNFDAKFYDINGEIDATSVEIDVARRGIIGNTPDVVRTVEITSAGQIAVLGS